MPTTTTTTTPDATVQPLGRRIANQQQIEPVETFEQKLVLFLYGHTSATLGWHRRLRSRGRVSSTSGQGAAACVRTPGSTPIISLPGYGRVSRPISQICEITHGLLWTWLIVTGYTYVLSVRGCKVMPTSLLPLQNRRDLIMETGRLKSVANRRRYYM